MTRRFDRDDQGGKIHLQSLCALAHYDFNAAGEYGYGIKGAADILAQVVDSVARWSEVADEAGVPAELKQQIARTHRLQLAH